MIGVIMISAVISLIAWIVIYILGKKQEFLDDLHRRTYLRESTQSIVILSKLLEELEKVVNELEELEKVVKEQKEDKENDQQI